MYHFSEWDFSSPRMCCLYHFSLWDRVLEFACEPWPWWNLFQHLAGTFVVLLVVGARHFPKLSVFDNMWCALRSYVCLVHLRLFDCMPMVLCSSQFDFESPFVSYHGTRLFAFELCFRSCRYRVMMSWCISARFMYRVRWPLYDLCVCVCVCLLQVAGGDVMPTRVSSLVWICIIFI